MKNKITNTLNYKFINNISFLDHVLQPPSYGWQDETGKLIKPSNREIMTEFFKRLNIFKDRRNWLPFFSWFKIACLIPFFFIFKLIGSMCTVAVVPDSSMGSHDDHTVYKGS